jgi:cobalt-zinc-cadmium efflux system protein
VLLLLGAAAYVGLEAVDRIGEDIEVVAGPMMVVGGIGLVVNLVALGLLRGGAAESLNVRGAYLEVVADTVGSVGVLVAGVLVARTGDAWWDTAVAGAIAVFVAVRAVLLGREVIAVLGQHAPAGMAPAEVEVALREVEGVDEVHDLHLWTLTSGMHVATAHLVATCDTGPVLTDARAVLRTRFGVEHATLQVESNARDCGEVSW